MGKRSPSRHGGSRVISGPGKVPPRLGLWFTGLGIGAAWGTVLWLVFWGTGQTSGAGSWLYITLTTAIIGGFVTTIYGAGQAHRRGERIGPRLPFPRRGRDR